MKRALSAIRAAVDVRDLHLYGGLVLLGVGASLAYPPAGPIVAGACLFSIAVFGIAPSRGGE